MDEGADYDRFYADAVPSLRRLAAARTGSWTAAEDVVQDAMSDAQRRWSVIGRYEQPDAWARRAVLNRSASWHRSRERERRAVARLAGRVPDESPDEPKLTDTALWDAIRDLSDRQSEVVLLLWFEDLSAAEVATSLGCGEETVRTHWRRARARLATALDLEDDASEENP